MRDCIIEADKELKVINTQIEAIRDINQGD